MPQTQEIRFGIAARISTVMRLVSIVPIPVNWYINRLSMIDEITEQTKAESLPAIPTA